MSGRIRERAGRRGRRPAGRRAFSLIELLLVLFIAVVAAGLTVPRFVRSAQSARLRASVRALVTASRLAQARAVLRQTTAALILDTGERTIEVALWDADAPAGGGAADPGGPPSEAPRVELTRPLEHEVRFTRVEAGAAGRETNGVHWVLYYPNGMCDGFEADLADGRGREAKVRVEPYAGRAEAEL